MNSPWQSIPDRWLFVSTAAFVLLLSIGIALWGKKPTTISNLPGDQFVLASGVDAAVLAGDTLFIQSNNVIKAINAVTGVATTSTFDAPDRTRFMPSSSGARLLLSPDGGQWQTIDRMANGKSTPLDQSVFAPAWSPDGQRIAYVFYPTDNSRTTLTLANADGTDWHSVLELPHLYEALWWSPLQTYLIGLDGNGEGGYTYVRVLLSSKRTETLASARAPAGLRWSTDGKFAAIDLAEGKLGIVTTETGEVRSLVMTTDTEHMIWESGTSMLALESGDTGKILRIDATQLAATVIGQLPAQFAYYHPLGVVNNTLILHGELQVISFPISARAQ